MAGPLILSNRLKSFQDSMGRFGETMQSIEQRQREETRQAEADRMAKDSHELGMKSGKLSLAEQERKAGIANQLQGLQSEYFNAVDGAGPLPADAYGNSVMPDSGRGYQDRLLSKMFTLSGTPTAPEDLQQKRRAEKLGVMGTEQALTLGANQEARAQERHSSDLKTAAENRKQMEMENKKMQAELDALAKGGIDPEKKVAIEQKLMTTYLNQNKPFTDVHDAYGRVLASVKDPSPAGDLALIFNYMKMLDPGSTVREGEFATAESAGSLPTTLVNKYNKVVSGERLGETRGDFIKQAKNLYSTAKSNYDRNRETFTGLSERYGVSPENVVIPLESQNILDAEKGPGQGAAPTIKSDAEFDRLPSGTVFIGADGKKRRKP